jgi:hypothetical protein
MSRVESAYAQSTSRPASFPHLVLRQRCQDHPIAMFNTLVLAAFVWTLAPTGSTLAPLSVPRENTSSVQILGTTAKTSRLPKRDVILTCPAQVRVGEWLECLTEVAREGGKVGEPFS